MTHITTRVATNAALPIDGPAAPPRANGELVFTAPWESRLFGMTMALIERGAFSWSDFQPELVAAIRAWEAKAASSEPYSYYERWQEALERVAARTAICSTADLESRAEAFAARPHGHDH
jgi:nitrile hydratase accessory protein